jgi:hypothetical protein
MIRKGQVRNVGGRDMRAQAKPPSLQACSEWLLDLGRRTTLSQPVTNFATEPPRALEQLVIDQFLQGLPHHHAAD